MARGKSEVVYKRRDDIKEIRNSTNLDLDLEGADSEVR